MNLLITGGAGYIGSHMVKHSLARGHEVTVLDNLSTGYEDALPPGILSKVDLLDSPSVGALLASKRFDGVIHFAGRIQVGESVKRPLVYYEQNITGMVNLLNACVVAGVKHFVFSSSAAVYGQPTVDVIDEDQALCPINPYGRTKAIGEGILADIGEAHGVRSVSLRYFNAAGADPEGKLGERHEPETHLIPLLLQAASGKRGGFTINGSDFPTPDGTCIRDYVHVNDLAEAHLGAMEYLLAGGATTAMNLGTGMGYSVAEVLNSVRRITSRDFPVNWGPRRDGDPARLVASNARARALLRWSPQLSDLETIIKSAWQFENSR